MGAAVGVAIGSAVRGAVRGAVGLTKNHEPLLLTDYGPDRALSFLCKKAHFGNIVVTADYKGVYNVKMHRWLTDDDDDDDDSIETGMTNYSEAQVHYRVSASKFTRCNDHSLIDRGANGGVGGNDVV